MKSRDSQQNKVSIIRTVCQELNLQLIEVSLKEQWNAKEFNKIYEQV